MSAKEAVQVALKDYATLIRSLTEAIASAHLTGGAASAQTPEQMIQRIIKHDEHLQQCLKDLSRHQEVQRQIEERQQQLERKEQFARHIAQQLSDIEKALSAQISDGHKLLAESAGRPLDVDEVVLYAHRLAFTTSAPPRPWQEGAPLFNYRPPMPQEAQMRSGWLYLQTQAAAADVIPQPSGDVQKPAVPAHVAQWKKDEATVAQPTPAGGAAPAAGSMTANLSRIARPEEKIELDINPDDDDVWESG